MRSVWELQSFPRNSDVIIIGAGLTGLLTAVFLKQKQPSLSVAVLERGAHPSGASVKNAGFGCFGSASELLDDIRSEGESTAMDRVVRRYEGLQKLLALVHLDTRHLQQHGGHEVFTNEDETLFRECKDALPYLNAKLLPALGFSPFAVEKNTWGFKTLDKAIFIKNEISLHSGVLVKNLMQKAEQLGVQIHTGVLVEGVDQRNNDWHLHTSLGTFTSARVVLATNGYSKQLFPHLPVEPARGQILLTAPIPGVKLTGNFHLFRGYYYFREFEGGVLLGGGRHHFREAENTFSTDISQDVQQELERVLREVILPGKQFTIAQRWAGTMAFGPQNEKEAIVQELQPGLFAGVRLGGMGVALSSAVAGELTGKVLK